MTILFLGRRDTLRAPLAAALFTAAARRDGHADATARSAGTGARPGERVHPALVREAARRGLDLPERPARRVRAGDLDGAIVVSMDRAGQDWIARNHPDARCHLASDFLPRGGGLAPGDDVPRDPGPEGALDRIWWLLGECCEAILRSLPESAEDAYARMIEGRFEGEEDRPVPLTAADWALIDRWWRREVPLWCVLLSIDEVLAREAARPSGRRATLTYIRPIVEERYEAWRRHRVPAAPARPAMVTRPPSTPLGAVLEEAARAIEVDANPRARRLIEQAARTAGEDPARDPGEVIETLTDALRAILDPARLRGITEEVQDRMGEHGDRMTPGAREITLRRAVDRRIREMYGIPDPWNL